MARFQTRDLVRLPGLLSLSRIPLAAAFPFVVGRPALALGVLLTGAVTDFLDGWVARRFDQVTATGAALDPVTDKIFVLVIAITLVVTKQLSGLSLLLLASREIGEIPLVVWLALRRRAHGGDVEPPTTSVAGKIVTGLQFATVTVVLVHAGHASVWVGTTAVAGAVAVFSYWRQALRARASRARASVAPR